jgi:hypothetical protein
MPADTDGAAGTQVDPATQPQAGDPPAPAADAQQPPTGGADGEGALDAAALQRELAKVRREAAGYRTRLQTFEDGQKTEAQKAADRIAELEQSNAQLAAARREDTLRLSATAEARRLGFRNPDIAYRLLAGSVEYDEAGAPKNVGKLLDDIAKAEPYLVNGTTDYGGGPRGAAPAAGTDMNTMIRRATGRN